MADQADKLRALAAEMKGKRPSKRQTARAVAPEALPLQPRARVVAISSGKGGVGKTNLAVNLGLALCRLGKRAVVFDADLGLANADLLLGLQPRYNLTHFFQGGRSLAEIMCDGPEGLKLIPTGSGIAQLADLSSQERERVLSHFALIEEQTDFLIVDTGAGISRNVMSFAHAAEEVLVVTTPEPTARLDAYGLIKVLSQEGYQGRLRLIVNMAESKAEGEEVSKLMQSLALRFLNIHVEPLGVVPRDRGVPMSVRQQRPFVVAAPNSAATAAVLRMAGTLAQVSNSGPATGGFIGFLDRLSTALRR